MVVVVRRTRASGLGVVTALSQQRSGGRRMSAARSRPLRARAREAGQGEAATRAGRLAAFLQRAAGFLSRQAFLAVVARFCDLHDASAEWFRQIARRDAGQKSNHGFFL